MNRFLCTTALEESWPDDGPVLFLGEWCRRHSRQDRWSRLDAEVLPYHWDDRAKLQADYRYLAQFHERLLQELTVELNELHGVDRSARYWRILIGVWLGYFVQILFDRWSTIQQSVREFAPSGSIVLCDSGAALTASDMVEFQGWMVEDPWNHQIYATILQDYTQMPCSRRPYQARPGAAQAVSSVSRKRRMKQSLAAWISRAASTLTRDGDAFLHSTFMPLREELRLHRRLGQTPQHWQFVPAVRTAFDADQRRWKMSGESRSQFEAFARAMIPAHLPTVYLEGYRRLVQQAARMPWPARPRLIMTSASHNYDDLFKVWAADKVEGGAPLVIGQHGGHLGAGRWSFVEDHDVAISDCYLSWGWTDPQHPNIRAACQLKARRPLDVRHAEQSRVLLVTCSFPRYSYWMYSAIVARQWLDYFEDQCTFVAHLPRHIREALTVRLYPQDFGWDQAARWHERMPDLHLDRGEARMDDLIRASRLYVSTYNATTYLESITMNVPTVIYWNADQWELRDSSVPFFAELRRVGVLHASPESAARHVAQIWDDVSSWWLSPAVREVIDNFKDKYCRVAADVAGCVEEAMRGLPTTGGVRQ